MGDRIRRALLAAAVVVGGLVMGASPAWAHNSLVESAPAKNAALAEPPTQVRLKFLSGLDAAGTSMSVTDPAGANVIGRVAIDGKVVSAPFTGKAPGEYTVQYEVLSSDGHVVKGSYRFTIAGASSPSAAPSPELQPASMASSDSSAAAQNTAEDDDTPWLPWIGGAAVAGLIVGGLISWWRQRKSG